MFIKGLKIIKKVKNKKRKDWDPDDEPKTGKRAADKENDRDEEEAMHKKKSKKAKGKKKISDDKVEDWKAQPMKKKKSKSKVKAKSKKKATGPIKDTGKFGGKSNALGQGGRAAQLAARGVPGGVIGNLARAAGAAPGQANYHKKGKKSKLSSGQKSFLKRVGTKGMVK